MGWGGLAAVLWLAGALRLAAAPAVEARLDTAQAQVGDPVHLELRLRYPEGAQPLIPALPALLADFSVRPEAPAEPVAAGGEREEVRRYELRIFQPGPHQIPPLKIGFVQPRGDTLELSTPALPIEVLRVRQAGDEELRDIKAPVELEGKVPAWAWGLLGALIGAGLAGALYWWLKRRRPPAPPPLPPKDYLAEFARIAAMDLLERGGTKIYYSLLAETLRRFLEESLDIEAMERTTAEISQALGQLSCEAALAAQIERFLRIADLVKFARLMPPLDEARQAPEAGKAIVRRVLELKAAAQAARQALEPAAAPTS